MVLTSVKMLKRPRRNRLTAAIRSLIRETHLTASDLISPLFLIEGENRREFIQEMPGIERFTLDLLLKEAELLHAQGVPAISLFPAVIPSLKNEEGSEAWNSKGLIPRALRKLKKEIPSLCVIADIALDPYTSHGHDGVVIGKYEIDNDLTLEALVKQSLTYAEAGCDLLAPSDMMDGRVKIIREALDNHGFENVGMISYTAKYASSFYGPFRGALGSSLAFGDKKTYQMDPSNVREAIREALLDEEEGADMLMVKPALPYLDVLVKIKENTSLPVGAYHVSGEYSMVMAAHEKGYLDAQKVFFESLTCIKRAGADFIFTYAANQILDLLN